MVCSAGCSKPFRVATGVSTSGTGAIVQPPSSPLVPAVRKNIVTDFSAACDGVADDSDAFNNFGSWALNWQKTNSGLVELVVPSGSKCNFMKPTGMNQGIKQFLLTAYGATFTISPP